MTTLTEKQTKLISEALTFCAEFLDDYVDVVDGADGQPQPNKAMQLMGIVDDAMMALDRAMNGETV